MEVAEQSKDERSISRACSDLGTMFNSLVCSLMIMYLTHCRQLTGNTYQTYMLGPEPNTSGSSCWSHMK